MARRRRTHAKTPSPSCTPSFSSWCGSNPPSSSCASVASSATCSSSGSASASRACKALGRKHGRGHGRRRRHDGGGDLSGHDHDHDHGRRHQDAEWARHDGDHARDHHHRRRWSLDSSASWNDSHGDDLSDRRAPHGGRRYRHRGGGWRRGRRPDGRDAGWRRWGRAWSDDCTDRDPDDERPAIVRSGERRRGRYGRGVRKVGIAGTLRICACGGDNGRCAHCCPPCCEPEPPCCRPGACRCGCCEPGPTAVCETTTVTTRRCHELIAPGAACALCAGNAADAWQLQHQPGAQPLAAVEQLLSAAGIWPAPQLPQGVPAHMPAAQGLPIGSRLCLVPVPCNQ